MLLDRHAIFHAEPLHHSHDPVGAEALHEVVLEREEEAAAARVALTARAAAELVVDPARVVALGAEDEEAARVEHLLLLDGALLGELRERALVRLALALRHDLLRELFRVAAEADVGAPARHVGRDRHCALPAGLRDDVRLAAVLLRVEDLVRDLVLLQDLGDDLRLVDGDRADEHRLPLLVAVLDLVDDRLELLALRPEHDVRHVVPNDGLVRRDHADREVVVLLELLGLGVRGARHARELLVHAEEVLVRDRRQRHRLRLDLHALLGLDRLVEAVGPAAPVHRAAGELVDDDDLVVLQEVLLTPAVERVRFERLVHVVNGLDVADVVEVIEAEALLHLLHTLVRERDGAVLLVHGEVFLADQVDDDVVDLVVDVLGEARLPRDDERRAGLVDEDRVDLVDDRVVEAALHHAPERGHHVVAQVVEPELVVRAVGDVARVGRLALRVGHAGDDRPGLHAEEAVELPHPLGVARGEVVVHRDQVRALAGQRVQVHRQGRRQRLALTGLHLRDAPAVHHDAADELHVVVPHPERAHAGDAHGREGLREELVERLALRDALLEGRGVAAQLVVAELLEALLERSDLRDERLHLLELAFVLGAEELLDELVDHTGCGLGAGDGPT